MDLVFNCPKCNQELEVDASGAGEEIECPACHERISIPTPESALTGSPPPEGGTPVTLQPSSISPIGSSAAAKIEMHLKVPVHDRPSEKLIAKAPVPLEVAAKESDRKLRVKCIRHIDCVEVGHDKFDEFVTAFLGKIGEQAVVSINTFMYTTIDISSQKLLTDFGVMIVYKG